MAEKPWSSNSVKKGDHIALEPSVGVQLSVEHMDRTIDPYLAWVIILNKVSYTGLHPTLADARRKCLEIYSRPNVGNLLGKPASPVRTSE